MLLTLDLDSSLLTFGAGYRAPVEAIAMQRSAGARVHMDIVQGGRQVELPAGTLVHLWVKAAGDWAGDNLAFSGAFVWTEFFGHYSATIDLQTAALNTAFGNPEKTSLQLACQVGYKLGGTGEWTCTQVVPFELRNSLIRDTVLAPSEPLPDGMTFTAGGFMQIVSGGNTYHVPLLEGEAPV